MPFSDDLPLIHDAFQIPSAYKIYQGWNKYLLRKSMEDILPTPIGYRKDKIGFATPSSEWLGTLRDDLRSFITRDIEEFINVKALLDDWDSLLESRPKWGQTQNDTLAYPDVWRIINFAVWWKVFELS